MTMNEVLSETRQYFSDNNSAQNKFDQAKKAILSLYATLEDVSWNSICDAVKIYKNDKIFLAFITVLLKNNIYHNDSADAIYQKIVMFETILEVHTGAWNSVFSKERIADLYYFPVEHRENGNKNSRFNFFFIPIKNPFLRSCFIDFVAYSTKKYASWLRNDIIESCEKSFAEYAETIKRLEDFNEYTFWQQINYYKAEYPNYRELRNDYENGFNYKILAVCNFYRFLSNQHPELHLFENASCIPVKLSL